MIKRPDAELSKTQINLWLVGIAACFVWVSCSNLEFTVKDYYKESPPGVIKVSRNLFLDQVEATNLNWREYLYWIENCHGKASEEYLKALPDTTVFLGLNLNYWEFVEMYLRHPNYSNYPVVGISHEQANAYSKWRSDRVMHLILIENDILPLIPDTNPDYSFSVERYFKGDYYGYVPSVEYAYYPDYSLPDSIDFVNVYRDIQSKRAQRRKKSNKPYLYEKGECNCIQIMEPLKQSVRTFPVPISTNSNSDDFYSLEYLCGNIREYTSKKGLVFGDAFVDTCSVNVLNFKADSTLANAYTGFRNTCRWRKWTDWNSWRKVHYP